MTLRISDGKGGDIEKKLGLERRKAERFMRKVQGLDFDSIVQRKDEIQPENRREIDYFKARNKLLTLLYETVQELGKYEDVEMREEKAREVVLRAIDLKAEMNEILITQSLRQLRQDRSDDNEFYVGRQGEIGSFRFERNPTPTVKIDDVVGASFDKAKRQAPRSPGKFAQIKRPSPKNLPGKNRQNSFCFSNSSTSK